MTSGIYTDDYFPMCSRGAIDGAYVPPAFSGFTATLSTVAGKAFISNPSVSLDPYIGYKITLTTGGKTLIGWIQAPGTVETYTEQMVNGTFVTDEPAGVAWTRGLGWVITGGAAVATVVGDTIAMTQAPALVAGSLYRNSYTLSAYTAGGVALTFDGQTGSTQITPATYTTYRTFVATAVVGVKAVGVTSLSLSNFSCGLVLTPSATGVKIVSAQGGVTQSWTSNDGIDANAANFVATISIS